MDRAMDTTRARLRLLNLIRFRMVSWPVAQLQKASNTRIIFYLVLTYLFLNNTKTFKKQDEEKIPYISYSRVG